MLRWTFAFLIALVLLPQTAEALDSCVVPHGQTYTINEHSVCRRVTNNAALPLSIMVPTSAASEWSTGANAFINATPPGVTIAACAACGDTANCGPSGGGAAPDEGVIININSSANNINLFTLAGSPTTADTFVFRIKNGVIIGSNSTATPALETGTFPAGSIVKIVNAGRIHGKGGAGGAGGGTNTVGASGAAGGTAISLSYNVSIDNANGVIFGGGGGGGGGAGSSCSSGGESRDCSGGGGGGGAGHTSTLGGTAVTSSIDFDGDAGSSGSAQFPSTGGRGGSGGYKKNTSPSCGCRAGAGGDSGDWGAAGENGLPSTSTQGSPSVPVNIFSGGTGGAAGNAIKLNGRTVTWIAGNVAAQRKGPIN